jgi:uncharacterized protein
MMESSVIFKDIVATEIELQNLMGTPSELANKKVIHFLDQHCQEFIAQSPFLMLSTADEKGRCDASPRGDRPGFVQVINDRMLIIPERKGNRRADSLMNILANPNVGLLFFIPGMGETLRLNGNAQIIKDKEFLQPLAVNGQEPHIGIVVNVEECFIHCAKAFRRSGMWDSASWTDRELLPSPAKMLALHAQIEGMDEEAVTARLSASYTNGLY